MMIPHILHVLFTYISLSFETVNPFLKPYSTIFPPNLAGQTMRTPTPPLFVAHLFIAYTFSFSFLCLFLAVRALVAVRAPLVAEDGPSSGGGVRAPRGGGFS